jgi:GTP-binding protein
MEAGALALASPDKMARVKIVAAEFVTSAASAADLLQTPLPELAFAGRSNVGKSSLINALAGRTLARTSAAPGKTRLANYYRLQPDRGPAFHLVDLPGYGYARGARDGRTFATLAQEYFFGGPQGDNLRPAVAWFSAQGCAVQLVGTKADKLSRAERQRAASAIVQAFGRSALMTSAASREGIDELWAWIAQQVEQWKQPHR